MAATVASTVAAVAAHPQPASPFAALLRRSRFASFDPLIRQTYTSPPAHVHRGDWGLKRPLPNRRKNAFITVSTFEHHAYFTEWDLAEDQVRLVRRTDEMDVVPRTSVSSSWQRGLGSARSEWLLDSDFCPEDFHDKQAKIDLERRPPPSPAGVNLDALGNQGLGAWSAARPIPSSSSAPDTRLMPNIHAMSHRQFKRYLTHLRAIRPDFKSWLTDHANSPRVGLKPIFAHAQNPSSALHRLFIQDHISASLSDPSSDRFTPQPHRHAALTYTHPSPLDTRIRTRSQPGMVLNSIPPGSRAINERHYVASYGGLGALLSSRDAYGKVPLLDPSSSSGVDTRRTSDSFARFRLVKDRPLVLSQPPRVVGLRPDPVDRVRLEARVVVVPEVENYLEDRGAMSRNNPHPPGSAAYVAAEPWNPRTILHDAAPKRRRIYGETIDLGSAKSVGEGSSVLLSRLNMLVQRKGK